MQYEEIREEFVFAIKTYVQFTICSVLLAEIARIKCRHLTFRQIFKSVCVIAMYDIDIHTECFMRQCVD